MSYQIRYDLMQPWSTFVMKTELPPEIVAKMVRITDEIIENKPSTRLDPMSGLAPEHPAEGPPKVGAGQVTDQFWVDLKIIDQEQMMEYFTGVCTHYVALAFGQSRPGIVQEELHAWPTSMWINSQKDNEYFEMHEHANCAFSSVMYLKIPEYLPDRKKYNVAADGAITFMDNKGRDNIWARSMFYIQPAVGDFLIFPAAQQHMVNPFRTADGKGERRSVSLNGTFSLKETI
jgi:hypothetical protein